MSNPDRLHQFGIRVINNPRPYVGVQYVVQEPHSEVAGRLPKVERPANQTYLQRYLLKERGRERVVGLGDITSRAGINPRRRDY